MALIVEDGSIVPRANSYIGLEDARVMAADYGYTLPEDDALAEAALRQGAVYIDVQEPAMCGRRVSADQWLAFPRRGMRANGFDVPSDSIPYKVQVAQVIAASFYGDGIDVRANTGGQAVTMERVEGAVTVQYAAPASGAADATVAITAALDALAAFLCGSVNGFGSFNVFRG